MDYVYRGRDPLFLEGRPQSSTGGERVGGE